MKPSRPVVVASLLFGGAAAGLYSYWKIYKDSGKVTEEIVLDWKPVGKVEKVLFYPVKSGKAVSVLEAEADHLGLLYNGMLDRSFIIVSDKGLPITGRTEPRTVLLQATFENHFLTLNFPRSNELQVDICQVVRNGERVATKIWGKEVYGLDCGEEVSQWLKKKLKRECKLLYYADVPASRVSEHPLKHKLRKGDDYSLFADFSAYMLMTTESIADLQSRGVPKVTIEDFRPNIVVTGAQKPYDEDEWKCIKIGGAIFRNVVPCVRCVFANVSAKTGKKHPSEPLDTLKKYRCREGNKNPFLGINLVLYVAGKVSVGDEVSVTRGPSINTE